MSQPKFSVIIPIHNKGPHLRRSINSVLNQTLQDFELILVDDASTDESAKIIQEYNAKNIKKFRRDVPGPGGYAARNLGINNSIGEYIAFLDADDEWYYYHLQKMYELILNYPENAFYSCGWEIQSEGQRIANKFYKAHNLINMNSGITLSIDSYLKNCIRGASPVCTIVACFKNNSSGGYKHLFPDNLGAKRGGDLYVWLKLLINYKQIAWSNHIGAIYHINSINMVTKSAPASFLLLEKKVYMELSQTLTLNQKRLLKKYFNRIITSMYVISKTNNFNTIYNTYYFKDVYLNGWQNIILLYAKKIKYAVKKIFY